MVKLQAVVDLLTDRWDRTWVTRHGAESVYRGRLNDMINEVSALAEEEQWIPVKKRLPETRDYILISFENFDIPLIGRCGPGKNGTPTFYVGANTRALPKDLIVNAWMPLPKCYRREKNGTDEKLQGM